MPNYKEGLNRNQQLLFPHKMEPTQIDVEKHLFEVISDHTTGEKYV